ncbi:hypothetical protein PQQ52_11470 [Paraburkholderia sediminicola]|uniref:hypothetical protein n=1 Tax=Paraburkholderia sediminicola TaxID=458836 RepID=UPI0038BAC8DC
MRITIALALGLLGGVAHAQQLPPATSSLNQVIAATVEKKAGQLGYTALSDVVKATEAAIGAEASKAAGALGGGAAWLSLPAALLGGLLAGTPTPLADGSVDQWTYNKDGTISISGNPLVTGGAVSGSPFAPLVNGQLYWKALPGSILYTGSSADAVAERVMEAAGVKSWKISCNVYTAGQAACTGTDTTNSGQVQNPSFNAVQSTTAWSGGTCSSGMATGTACAAYSPQATPVVTPETVSPSAAIGQIPASDDALPLSPDLVADLGDSLWQQASQEPGYNGVPYPVDSPITSADASSVQSSSGSSWPSVSAATSGVSSPSGASSGNNPYSIPNSTTPGSSSPASSPAATPPTTVDLGPNPGVGSPTLEQIPTAAQIMAPILGMLPDLKNYGVPAHNAQCPEPSVTVFGTVITVTAQCTLAEQFRSQIYVTFVLVFSLAALFIVLTA